MKHFLFFVSATYGEGQDTKTKDVPLEVDVERIKPFAFPTYTAPDFKDDMVRLCTVFNCGVTSNAC